MDLTKGMPEKLLAWINELDEKWTTVQRKNRQSKSEKSKPPLKRLPLAVQDDEPWVVEVKDRHSRLEAEFLQVEEDTFCRPHAKDFVFTKARAAVIAHNRSTLARFINPIRVESLSKSPTSFNGTESSVQKLALLIREGLLISIPVKIVRKSAHGKSTSKTSDLVCYVWLGWQKFEEYLETIRDVLESTAIEPRTGDTGLKQQRSSWSKSDKYFRIMDLPMELRIMILKECLGHRQYPSNDPYHTVGSFWYCGRGSEDERYASLDGGFGNAKDPTKEMITKPNLDILQAHPKFYYEVKNWIQYQVPKTFDHTFDLTMWINIRVAHAPRGTNCLQHVHLGLSHKEYIDFFRGGSHAFPTRQSACRNCTPEPPMLEKPPHSFPIDGC